MGDTGNRDHVGVRGDPGDPVRIDRVDAAEIPAFLAAFDTTFGHGEPSDDHLERFRELVPHDRLVAARNAVGEIVGTAGALEFDLALPGAATAPCAGVTVVSVRADHRRRGVLTRMMDRLLDDAAERGEAFAALWASEQPIYGRYGFGPAAPTIDLEVTRAHAGLHLDGPVDEVRLIDAERAARAFPPIYDRYRRQRPGMLSYSPGWWSRRVLADVPAQRDGAGPMRYASIADRGFATYRLRPSWSETGPDGVVEVGELIALDAAAAAALWRFVIETDLSVRTRATRRPVDDPVLHLVADAGRVKVSRGSPLFLRLVDVAAALEARSYRADVDVVLEIEDRARPANTGRWQVRVRDGIGTCERTQTEPDLRLSADVLATVALGGVRTTALHAAGRVAGPLGVAAALDRAMATDLAPWHGGMF